MAERKLSKLVLLVIAMVSLTAIAVGQSSTKPPGDKVFDPLHQKYLLGDWGGERTKLEERGVTFDFFFVSDMLANVKGGTEKEAGWNRVRGTMDLDFARMFKMDAFKGLTLHVTGLWQGGVNLGGGPNPHTGLPYFGSIANPSGLVSAHTTRLDSFWLQETMFNNIITVRAGQFAGMDFYGVQNYGGNYLMEPLDYAFGNLFTTYESFDPASGPAAEIKFAPFKQIYYRTAVMSGNHDPYGDDKNGFHFTAKNKGSWLNEIGLLLGQSATSGKKNYPGLYKVGSAFNPDYFLNPLTDVKNHKNYLVYFMGNQAVYRSETGSNKGLDVHFAVDFAPSDYNRVDREITSGFVYNGPIAKRPKDSLAFGLVWNHISDNYNAYYAKVGQPLLTAEKAFEVNYLTQVTPWWIVQPTVQVYNDLGANPKNGNGVIVGLRTKITF